MSAPVFALALVCSLSPTSMRLRSALTPGILCCQPARNQLLSNFGTAFPRLEEMLCHYIKTIGDVNTCYNADSRVWLGLYI